MSERPSPRRPVKVTVLGPSGDGKSQFLSMLFGSLIFSVEKSGFSCTQLSAGVPLTYNKRSMRLIDQPSFYVLEEDEQGHLDSICYSLKQEQYINAICLVFRVTRDRVDLAIQKTFRNVRNLFATPDIYKHLCLVITHTDTPQKKTTFLNNMLPAINVEIDELFGNSEKTIPKLPIFFVDSAINPNPTTLKEKERFLAHVSKLGAIPTTSINPLDARYNLVTEEIVEDTRPGTPRPHMITIVRNGIQEKPECGESMPVTIHQNVRRLRFESLTPDENGNTTSYRILGPVGEPWPTEDDSHVRVFKKQFFTKTTVFGAKKYMQKNFNKKGKCIEKTPWLDVKDAA
ncbi:hypothetical protein BLNAU_19147 [Blattamonas nauphoetae]|uniref:AIG1-type G domain-containing protein n=1 Tax=Blattamonas nauphoetae TaxID=2049346 RepID=A0ABQ9X2J8_9EUKA|nr:hypothetical protein BLNAU_19147 [Blattamonas nauphoetae]